MAIQVWLEKSTSDKIRLPVNPPSLDIQHAYGWNTVDLATMQQYAVGGGKQLDKVSLASFFPKYYNVGYCEYSNLTDPLTLVNKIRKWASDKSVIKLVIVGDFAYKQDMLITSFTPSLVGGITGEISWTLELMQNYAPVMKKTKVSTPAKTTPKPASPNKTNTGKEWVYTVKSGDNLWNICKKYYNAPTRCWDLAKKNGIKNPNLIYPKQKLKMWAR